MQTQNKKEILPYQLKEKSSSTKITKNVKTKAKQQIFLKHIN